jgi:misacylated tRNA(Ala) deacylase
MTEHLYQTDSYVKEFEAMVTAVEGQAVALDRTAFYPGGGGQPNDIGSLAWDGGSAQVVRVKRRGADLWHTLEGDVPPTDTQVHATLDWERRYRLMRTHTALHVLCGVVWRDYGASVTGGNMEPLKGRMDFEFETMRKELVAEIEASVNAEIAQGHPVRIAILPREEAFQIPDLIRTKINLLPPQIKEVRTVELVGLDLQADGGTHVANTDEVGRVRLVDYKSKGAINKRIYIELEEHA